MVSQWLFWKPMIILVVERTCNERSNCRLAHLPYWDSIVAVRVDAHPDSHSAAWWWLCKQFFSSIFYPEIMKGEEFRSSVSLFLAARLVSISVISINNRGLSFFPSYCVSLQKNGESLGSVQTTSSALLRARVPYMSSVQATARSAHADERLPGLPGGKLGEEFIVDMWKIN